MNAVSYERPRMTNYPQLWWRKIKRNWPFMIWLAVLAFILLFYSRNQRYGRICGMMEVIDEAVVPLETARLTSLAVMTGQHVKAGDVLAQMDTSLIDSEIAIQENMLRDARETSTTYQRQMVASVDQAEAAVKSAEAVLKKEEMQQRSDEAKAQELRKELARREGLLAQRLMDATQVNELRPQIAALEQELAAYPAIIETYRQAYQNAEDQRTVLQNWLRMRDTESPSAAISNKMASSVSIIQATLEKYIQRRNNYTLRANRDGIVARILVEPGNVVPAGTVILRIVDEQSRNVIGFLPEGAASRLQAGQPVVVWSLHNGADNLFRSRAHLVPGTVLSITPDIESLPDRINPMQVMAQGGTSVRGRRIVCRLDSEAPFSPGEAVEIREVHAGWAAFLDRLVLP